MEDLEQRARSILNETGNRRHALKIGAYTLVSAFLSGCGVFQGAGSPVAPEQTQSISGRDYLQNKDRLQKELDSLVAINDRENITRKLYDNLPAHIKLMPYEAAKAKYGASKPAALDNLPDLRPMETSWLPPLKHDYGVLDGHVNLEDFFAFAMAFGLRKGQEGYDARFDTVQAGNSKDVIDLEDFFAFAMDFDKKQSVLPLEISHLLTPAGTMRISYPKDPAAVYRMTEPGGSAAKPAVLADGFGGFDVDASDFMGKEVRLKVRGEREGESIYGGLAETRVPTHIYTDKVTDGSSFTFNLPADLRGRKIFSYVILGAGQTQDYKFGLNQRASYGRTTPSFTGGNSRVYIDPLTEYVVGGTNTIRYKGQPATIIIADSDQLKLSSN